MVCGPLWCNSEKTRGVGRAEGSFVQHHSPIQAGEYRSDSYASVGSALTSLHVHPSGPGEPFFFMARACALRWEGRRQTSAGKKGDTRYPPILKLTEQPILRKANIPGLNCTPTVHKGLVDSEGFRHMSSPTLRATARLGGEFRR